MKALYPRAYARVLIVFLILVISLVSTGQAIFFDHRINESILSEQEKVHLSLRGNYSQLVYAKENAFEPATQFKIKLPDNSIVTVIHNKWQHYSDNNFSYIGKLSGQLNSSVVLSKSGNRWYGMITNESNEKFIIHQTAEDVFALSSVNETSFLIQDKLNDTETAIPGGIAANFNICDAVNQCTANPVTINIMVVYTAAAATAFGGTDATTAALTTAISNMNLANSNSGVNAAVQFNLAHSEQIVYTESGTTGTDLSRLAGTADGFMDNVHLLRDIYEADLVSLIVGSPTTTCGIGYLNTNPTNYNATSGFNVTVYNCVVSNFSLSHELGHNMGLRHDRYVDVSITPCAYHHGYVNQAALVSGAPSNKRWRTILAYNNQCAASGFNCSRINYWSNPSTLNTGDPMGIIVGDANAADEVYGINRFACVVASFRGQIVLPLNFINVHAAYSGNSLKVNWQTANESVMEKFEVEVATGLPQQFTTYATVAAKNQLSNFYNTLISLDSDKDLFLRIKSISADRKIKYSSVVYLKNGSQKYDLVKLVSNQVNNELGIVLNNTRLTDARIKIFSSDGKMHYSGKMQLPPGQNLHTINVSGLSKGYYILNITTGTDMNNIKFLKY